MYPQIFVRQYHIFMRAEQVVQRIRRAKLFVASRAITSMICLMRRSVPRTGDPLQVKQAGTPAHAPARLALAVILQAYTGVSDDEVIEATLMDRRGALVLDCLDADQAPFSKGTFVAFRKRLPSHFKLIFKRLCDFSTEALDTQSSVVPASHRWYAHALHVALHAGHRVCAK